jgi:hypothetical protein
VRRVFKAAVSGLGAVISTAAPVYAATTTPAATTVPANPGAYTIHLKTLTGVSLTVTLRGIIDPADTSPDQVAAGPGSRFVAAVFTITNRSEKQSLSDDAFQNAIVVGSDNLQYSSDVAAVAECSSFDNGAYDLLPGQSATGCTGFQLADSVRVTGVKWITDSGTGNLGVWRHVPPVTATVPGVPIPCQDQYADGDVFICGPTAATGYVLKVPAPGAGSKGASGPLGGASSPASVVLHIFNDFQTGQLTASCDYYPPGTNRENCVTGAKRAEQNRLKLTGTMQVPRVVTFGSLALVAITGHWCITSKSPDHSPSWCSENTKPNEGMPAGGLSFQRFAAAYQGSLGEVFSPVPCALIHGRWYAVPTMGLA